MARIAGIDIPKNKRGEVALTYIYGIGRSTAKKILLEAFKKAIDSSDFVSTDDSEFVTKLGKKVKIILGDEINMKVTFPHDLIIAEQLLNLNEN